jgi:hypothetical protein
MGQYLYGAGYFARDDNTLGVMTGRESPPHFCLRCPRQADCEDEHEQRVRQAHPEESEQFDRLMKEGLRRGAPSTLLAMMIGRSGKDPFALVAIENFQRGHGERGHEAGPLVQ